MDGVCMRRRGARADGAPPAEARRAFGALRHRDFRLFWGGALISHVGAWMQQVAQAWLIYDLTGSAFLVGLTGVFLSVPFITMSFYAGTVVDRVDRKRLLIWIEFLSMANVVGVGLLVWTGWIEVWHIYASNVFQALLGAFESPTRSSLLPYLVPRADLMTAISLHAVLRRGSQMVGPALGGVALAAIGVAGTYFVNAGAGFVLLCSLLLIKATNPISDRTAARPLQAIVDGLRYVRRDTVIRTLLLMEAALSLFGSFNPMMVIFAREVFEVGPQGLGLLQAASGAGTVAGSLALAAAGDVRQKGRLVILGAVIYGLAVASFAFCPWFTLALVILATAGAADIVMGAIRTTIIQFLARGEMLGRVMSLHAISTRGVGPFGGSQIGAMTEFVGVQSAVAFGALVCVGVALTVAWRAPRVRSFTGSLDPSGGGAQTRAAAPVRADEAVALR